MKRDEAKQLADQALKELGEELQAGKSETLLQILAVMSRFHNYSWNNSILICRQNPDATRVAGFRSWPKFGRHVRKGEKGIGILAPMSFRRSVEDADGHESMVNGVYGFKIVHVFDISQTDGDELPELSRITGEPRDLLDRLERVVKQEGIELTYESLATGVKGISRRGAISVSEGLDDAESFAILAHESAHERMHDEDRRKESTATVLETEAEAVAYVVCRAFGLDCSTRSSDYIQLYRGNAETLSTSLELVQKTATWMIEAINDVSMSPAVEAPHSQVPLTQQQ